MANNLASKKLHSFCKSERLCNFTLKNLLFEKGNTFQMHPIKVFWMTLDHDLEKVLFQKSVTEFMGTSTTDNQPKNHQNPSFPHKIIPANAFFTHPAKCLCGVSAKVHKSAATRNHLKRLIKEAYRQNKAPFYSFLEGENILALLAIIYTGKPVLAFHEIEAKIIVSLQKIQQKIGEQQKS